MKRLLALSTASLFLVACADEPSGPRAVRSDLSTEAAVPSAIITVNTTGDYECTQAVTGRFENLIVPDLANCTVTDATITGNVLIKTGGRLRLTRTNTGGGIDGAEAALVQIRGGRHGGGLQVQEGASPGAVGVLVANAIFTNGDITVQQMTTGSIVITDVQLLNGNLKVAENTTSGRIDVLRNRVNQGVEIVDNFGLSTKTVRNNTVGQKLTCKSNDLPFIGSPNSALDFEDQCTR